MKISFILLNLLLILYYFSPCTLGFLFRKSTIDRFGNSGLHELRRPCNESHPIDVTFVINNHLFLSKTDFQVYLTRAVKLIINDLWNDQIDLVRFAIITISSGSESHLEFDFTKHFNNSNDIFKRVDEIQKNDKYQNSQALANAFKLISTQIIPQTRKAANVPHLVLLFDYVGLDEEDSQALQMADQLKDNGAIIFVVQTLRPTRRNYKTLVSDSKKLFTLKNPSEYSKPIEKLSLALCATKAAPENKCSKDRNKPVDITFLLQDSSSISNETFHKSMLPLVKTIVDDFHGNIGRLNTRVSLILFGQTTKVAIPFDSSDNRYSWDMDLTWRRAINYLYRGEKMVAIDFKSINETLIKEIYPNTRKVNVPHIVFVIAEPSMKSQMKQIQSPGGTNMYFIPVRKSQSPMEMPEDAKMKINQQMCEAKLIRGNTFCNSSQLLDVTFVLLTDHDSFDSKISETHFNIYVKSIVKSVMNNLWDDSQEYKIRFSIVKSNIQGQSATIILDLNTTFHSKIALFQIVDDITYGNTNQHQDLPSALHVVKKFIDPFTRKGNVPHFVLIIDFDKSNDYARDAWTIVRELKSTRSTIFGAITTTSSKHYYSDIVSRHEFLMTLDNPSDVFKNVSDFSTKICNAIVPISTQFWPTSVTSRSISIQTNVTEDPPLFLTTIWDNEADINITTLSGKSNNFLFTNLKPFTEYKITWGILIKNEFYEDTEFIISKTSEEVPSEPEGIFYDEEEITNSSALLSWSTPSDLNGQLIHYEVNCLRNNSSSSSSCTNQVNNNSCKSTIITRETEANLTSLNPATNYSCSIITVNGVGKSNATQPVMFTTKDGYSQQVVDFQLTKLNPNHMQMKWQMPSVTLGKLNSYALFIYRIDKEINKIICEQTIFVTDNKQKPDTINKKFKENFPKSNCSMNNPIIKIEQRENLQNIEVNVTNIELPKYNYSMQVYPINNAGPGHPLQQQTLAFYPEVNFIVKEKTSSSVSLQSSIPWNSLHPFTQIFFLNEENKTVHQVNLTGNRNSLHVDHLEPFSKYRIHWIYHYPPFSYTKNRNEIIQTQSAPPGHPEMVKYNVTGGNSAILYWQSPLHKNGLIENYIVTCTSSLSKQIIQTVNGLSLKLNQLIPATRYNCSISAVNNAGQGHSSELISFQTNDGQSEPIWDLQFNEFHDIADQIQLTWQKPKQTLGVVHYYVVFVYRIECNSSKNTCHDVIVLHHPHKSIENMNKKIQEYFPKTNCTIPLENIKLYQLKQNSSSKVDLILLNVELPKYNYTVEIYPINGAGAGQVLQGQTSAYYEDVNFTIDSVTSNSVTLKSSWKSHQNKSHPLTEIILSSPTDPWPQKVNFSSHSNTIIVDDLSAFTNYSIQWRVNYAPYWYDGFLNQTIKTNISTATEPKRLSIKFLTNTTASLVWQKPEKLNHISFYYELSCASAVDKRIQNVTTDSQANLTSLQPSTNYTCSVFVVNAAGKSNSSKPLTFQTLDGHSGPIHDYQKTEISADQIQLTWQPPKQAFGDIKYYMVFVYRIEKPFQQILCHDKILLMSRGDSSMRSVDNVETRVKNDFPSSNCSLNSNEIKIKYFENKQNVLVNISNFELPKYNYSLEIYPVNGAGPGDLLTAEILTFYQEVKLSLDSVSDTSVVLKSNFNSLHHRRPFIQISISSDKENRNLTSNNMQEISIPQLNSHTHYNITWRYLYDPYWYSSQSVLSFKTKSSPASEPKINSSVTLTNTTASLQWERPDKLNGELSEYEVVCDSHFGQSIFKSKENQLKILSLIPATSYKCHVVANNDAGIGKPSKPITFLTKDGKSQAVREFEIIESAPDQIQLTWKPPQNTFGNLKYYALFVYRVKGNTNSATCNEVILIKDSQASTEEIESSLKNDFPNSNCTTRESGNARRRRRSIDESTKNHYRIETVEDNNKNVKIIVSNLELPAFNYSIEIYPVNGAGPGSGTQTKTQSYYEVVDLTPGFFNDTTLQMLTSVSTGKKHPLTEISLISHEEEDIHVNVSETDEWNVIITNLVPFTEYYLEWRYNYGPFWYEGKNQKNFKTSPAPPTEPLAFSIGVVTNTSAVLSWLRPRRWNGISKNYKITCSLVDNPQHSVSKLSDETSITLHDLHPGMLYTCHVIAINFIASSQPSESQLFPTKDGVSGQVRPLKFEIQSNEKFLIKWKPPLEVNGHIRFYALFLQQVNKANLNCIRTLVAYDPKIESNTLAIQETINNDFTFKNCPTNNILMIPVSFDEEEISISITDLDLHRQFYSYDIVPVNRAGPGVAYSHKITQTQMAAFNIWWFIVIVIVILCIILVLLLTFVCQRRRRRRRSQQPEKTDPIEPAAVEVVNKLLIFEEEKMDEEDNLSQTSIGLSPAESVISVRTKRSYADELTELNNLTDPQLIPSLQGNTRIILDKNPNGPGYNGNWVLGNTRPDSRPLSWFRAINWIAAEAPKEDTLIHFWKMIWQCKVNFIVLLMEQKEFELNKHVNYLQGNSIFVDEFSIEFIEQTVETDFMLLRNFKITNTTTAESRVLSHLHYTHWDEATVPTLNEFDSIVNETKTIIDTWSVDIETTALILCSDGEGRTGTFVTIMKLLSDLSSKKNHLDVVETILMLRMSRLHIVKTSAQLEFIYRYILHYDEIICQLNNSPRSERQ